MPCYEVNVVSVEFKAKNLELLEEALKEQKISYMINPQKTSIQLKFAYRSGKLDLESGQAEVDSRDVGKLNALRVSYSRKAIEKAAKIKKWVLKQQGQKIIAQKW